MVKLLFLCRRRPDITHDRYVSLLLDGHVPLALRHHPTLRRYAVNVVEETFGGAAPLDSIGALWFDSFADFRDRLYDSPAGERIVTRDVARFIGSAHGYVVREEIVRARPDTPTPGPKLVVRVAGSGDDVARAWSGAEECVLNRVERGLAATAPPLAALLEVRLAPAAPFDVAAPAYRVAEHVQRA
jgi:hypothetical protein